MRRPWIKIETCTPDKPEICSLATQVKLDEDTVVGKLVRLWSWAELNHINPNDIGVTKEFIDKLVGRKGFASALEKTGWLIETDGKLSFRNFKRHNSPVAQNKALTAKRVARHRLRKATGKQKVTEKALPSTPVEAPKAQENTDPTSLDQEVIIPDSSLVINEQTDAVIEAEMMETGTVLAEPQTEPSAPDQEPETPGTAAMIEEEAPVVEGDISAPAEAPAPRKRRGKAAESDDQPLLF